jgi:hypothetical protein
MITSHNVILTAAFLGYHLTEREAREILAFWILATAAAADNLTMNDQDQNIKEMEEKISMLQAEIQILIDRITKIETAADK